MAENASLLMSVFAILYCTADTSYGYPVFTSPLVSFLKPNKAYIALADPQGRIFINPNYVRNKDYLDYLIVHEAGRLSDLLFATINKTLSPILFPWTVFFLYLVGTYLIAAGYIISGNLFKACGLALIFIIIILWLKYRKRAEYRADEYAIKMIGFSAVVKALEELSLSHRTTESMSKFLGSLSFNDRLERIRQKWGGL